MQLPIVLIGPMCAGKSTVARALATRLDLPQVPLDAVRFYYHLKAGMSWTEMRTKERFPDLVRYWQPYSIDAVERVLADFPDSVIDFGAGHAHYEDPAYNERLLAALADLENVFLLMPSDDLEEGAKVLNERAHERGPEYWTSDRVRGNEVYLRSEVFRKAAKHTVLTDGTVDDAVDAIVRRLG